MKKSKLSKIYVAGGLTHTRPEIRRVYEKIRELAKEVCDEVDLPHLVTDPANTPHLDPADVWKRCHREVASADLLIAYVGEPSLGVGQELEIARVTHTDIIMWWLKGQKVSRMALGNPLALGKIEAEDEEDLFIKMKAALSAYSAGWGNKDS